MRRKLSNIVSVVHSFFRFCIMRLITSDGMQIDGIVERFSPNVIVEVERKGRMKIGKKVRAHSGCIFKVRKNAELILEDECSFNYGCMVFCRKKIVICEGVEFGPSVKIYDHDHDYRVAGGVKAGLFSSDDVFIGKNSWIGANTVILKGTCLGENCVVGAGSILKGSYPDNSVIIQKRETCVK